MSTPGYSWHVGTLIDGQITTEIPVVFGQSQWQLVMDDAGTLQVTVALSDPTVAGLDLRVAAEPARCFLALGYTDSDGTETLLEAGPIWSHSYDADKRQLTIRASGLWSLWDHRLVWPALSPPGHDVFIGPAIADAVAHYDTLSLGTIAQRLVQAAQTWTGGSAPVVFPGDETGTASRSYLGYELNKIGDALRNLTAAQGGPEIQFVPRRTVADPTKLEWVMRAGTTEAPLLTQVGADWVWDLTAPKSPASGLQVTRDGSQITGRVWLQGAGNDQSTLFARADTQVNTAGADAVLVDAGFPLLESADTSHSGESDATNQAVLNAYAAEDIALYDRPVETWTFTVQRDETPMLGTYQIGDWVALTSSGDPYLPDGTYRSRIVNLSGDDTNQVKVSLAPMIGSI